MLRAESLGLYDVRSQFMGTTVPATINLSKITSARLCESRADNLAFARFCEFGKTEGKFCLENLSAR